MIDQSIITGLAAMGGSLVGGVSSFATTYFTQTYQGRRERLAREIEQREILYAQFIDQAAALFLDSIDKVLEDPSGLITLGAVMARIRLNSEMMVIEASEAILGDIIASYERPPVDRLVIINKAREDFTDPLSKFTMACRNERMYLLKMI